MEFTKQDMRITKGVAILFMLLLHLFCRKDVNGLYETFPVVNGVPLIYYIGLFGDACVPMFCFASGYGLFVSIDRAKGSILKKNFERILKLLINYWIVLIIFVAIGFIVGNTEIFPGSLTQFLLHFFVLSSSYNGAWWFLQTYIILVLMAPSLFKVIKKYNPILILLISGLI
ncbi:acyltransferase family protein, partial [Neobacillus sp. MM2021_6]